MEGRQSVRRLAGATAVVLALGATIADITKQAASYRKLIEPYKWTQAVLNGRLYAFPWDSGPMALFYRRSVFKQAGINPNSIQTWNDYYKAGLKLKAQGIPIWLQAK